MAPPRPPGKRRRISVLEAVVVVVGFLAIIGYNRLNLVRLQRSLPNVNDKIVGEWKSERGPAHLLFRSDDSVSMTLPPAAAGDESGAGGASGPPPVTGKYKLTQGGRIYIQLMNGKKYHTTISPINPNRFDLIDSETDGVTTYDRLNTPAAGAANEAPPPASAAEEAPAAAATPPAAEAETPPTPPASTAEEPPAAPGAPSAAEETSAAPSAAAEETPPVTASPSAAEATPPAAATSATEAQPAADAKSPVAKKKKHH